MVFTPQLLRDLMEAIQGRDFVSAIAFRRRPPFTPALWKTVRMGLTPEENRNEEFKELPEGVFEVEACGMACCLMRAEIIKAVIDKYHAIFNPLPGYGEDISFCIRARGCGYKLHAASGIRVGHMAQTIVTEDTWRAWNGGEHNA
jgi:GT2 family glycosyltransferase